MRSINPPTRSTCLGFLYYDWIGQDFYDGRLHATWRPSVAWQLSADYSHAVPGLFLPKNSIFSVFSDDAYNELSLTLRHRFDERRSTYVFERVTWYEEGSSVLQTGLGLDVRYGPGGENAVGFEISYHDERRHPNATTDSDGDAFFARAYHRLYWTARIYTSADLLTSLYAGSPFQRDSRIGRLLLGYQPREDVDLQIGVESLRNAEFQSSLDALARLTFRF